MYYMMSAIMEDASIPIRFLMCWENSPENNERSTATIGSLSEVVIMRKGLNCQSPTEAQYYSGNNELYWWPQVNY